MIYKYGHGLLSLPAPRVSIFKRVRRRLENAQRNWKTAQNERHHLKLLRDFCFIEKLSDDRGTRTPLDPATGLDELEKLLRKNQLIITDGSDHFAVKVPASALQKHLKLHGNRAMALATQIYNP